MPDYKVIPLHNYYKSKKLNKKFKTTISGLPLENLPSWTSVLQKLDPSPYINCIRLTSRTIDVEKFILELHQLLKELCFDFFSSKWISFIVTPVKICSDQTQTQLWFNEITDWSSYSIIEGETISDYSYTFEFPICFLDQVARRGTSWPYEHLINPNEDIAINFLGTLNITPTIKNTDRVHLRNIKWQYTFWTCHLNELSELQNLIVDIGLILNVLNNENDELVLIIQTPIFNPQLGLYSVPMSWDKFDVSILNKLKRNGVFKRMPGKVYNGKIAKEFDKQFDEYKKDYTSVIITNKDYIPGFPIRLNDRKVEVLRFQMIEGKHLSIVERFKSTLSKIKKKKHLSMSFSLIDNTWEPPIYELSLSWTPQLNESSKDSFDKKKQEILDILNYIMPTNNSSSFSFKNSFDILHMPGQIYFEGQKWY